MVKRNARAVLQQVYVILVEKRKRTRKCKAVKEKDLSRGFWTKMEWGQMAFRCQVHRLKGPWGILSEMRIDLEQLELVVNAHGFDKEIECQTTKLRDESVP